MAGKKQLRPVDIPNVSVGEAIRSGDRLEELRAMQRVIAAHIDDGDTLARDLAPLVRQVREISKEIEELEKAREVEAGEDLGVVVELSDGKFDYEAI